MYSITLNAEFQIMGQAIASMENRFQNLFEHFISCHLLVTACNHDRGPEGRIKCLAAVCYFMYRVRLILRRRWPWILSSSGKWRRVVGSKYTEFSVGRLASSPKMETSCVFEMFLYSFLHSFCILPYERSMAFLKQVLYRVQSNASLLNFQYFLVSLRSSSSCLRLLFRLPVTFNLPTIFP
jgi:hypothetical protein